MPTSLGIVVDRELQWLPVRQLAVLMYKALHGQLPQYWPEDCQLLTDIGRRSLWSADVLTCATRRTRKRLRDGSFPSLDRLSGTLCLSHYVTKTSLFCSLKDILKTLWFATDFDRVLPQLVGDDIVNTLFKYWVSYRKLIFIIKTFRLFLKSSAKFDSLVVNIRYAIVCSLEKVNFKV